MAYKVGDKIAIKKPKQVNKYEETLKDIIEILHSKNIEDLDKLETSKLALQVLEEWFTKEDRNACLYGKRKIIPKKMYKTNQTL